MEMILIFIVIYFAGIITTTLVSINKINEYEEEAQVMNKLYRELEKDYEEQKERANSAEKRATIHFERTEAIERILNQDEKTREFATFTVNKIKEVIQSPNMK